MHSPLFRPAALEAIRPTHTGAIVLAPGASSRWVAWSALAVILALIALAGWGSYTRRSTVSGQLFPSEGLIRITAAQPGVVIESHVRDGQVVERGAVLFVLSGDRNGPNATAYQHGISSQIDARRRSLETDVQRLSANEAMEAEQLRRRASSLRNELEQVARQAEPLNLRLAGAEDAAKRYASLLKQGYVSRDETLAKEAEWQELRGRMQGNRRDALALDRELGAVQRELDQVAARFATQRSELERAVLVANQEFTEVEARRRVVVSAPASGRVSLLQAEVGQSVEAGRALAQLVPASAKLVARLFVPSRSAGFVQAGAKVSMRFDAFPHQQFGQFAGEVLSVSTAAIVSQDIQGFTPGPDLAGQALFEVTVALPDEPTSNTGQRVPLQAGMRLEADLLHETRRLYEWMVEPLLTARSRVSNS